MTSKTKSFIKYIFAFALLVIVVQHAQTDKIYGYLKQVSPLYLLLAYIMVLMAQCISALRMRFFFHASGFEVNRGFSVVLFFVGAFYNFLLPGGIGGDAYKVMLARRRLDMSTAQGIRIMVADRASGLCVLMLLTAGTMYPLNFNIPYATALLIAGTIVMLICYLFFSKWLLKQSPLNMIKALPYSIPLQILWIASIYVIWGAIGHGQSILPYIVLYCAASVTGMIIPISVGGLGVKEMTFYYGATIIQHFTNIPMDPELGIALSLCVFALLFFGSLPGILWLGKVTSIHHGHVSK